MSEFRLNVSAERLPIATDGSAMSGVEPGPSGSVMVLDESRSGVPHAAAATLISHRPGRELRTNRMVAAADAIWVRTAERVLRVQMAEPREWLVHGADLSAMAEGGRLVTLAQIVSS